MKNDGISTIYDSDRILHKVGSRKGKTKKEIAKKEASIKNGNKRLVRMNRKKPKLNPFQKLGRCLLKQNVIKTDKRPDFTGEVILNHDLLQRLLDESYGRDIKLTIGAWVKDSQFDEGKQLLSCDFSTNELSD
tara:strand:- start:237 stop:635 length:399 start_codon:yes stop_codon:yes gene_type:complete